MNIQNTSFTIHKLQNTSFTIYKNTNTSLTTFKQKHIIYYKYKSLKMEDNINNLNSSLIKEYKVIEGDNLIRISMKLNISVARLKKYNHLFGKNDVIVGQV